MFSPSAKYYDALYAARGKDYGRESEVVTSLIQRHIRSAGNSLLDVACGTGGHLVHLRKAFQVEGLDLDAGMLASARKKLPDVPLHEGDMTAFDLGHPFDVVVCLFSSIGYVRTIDRLQVAIANMEGHLKPGGVLVVEPWFTPASYHPGQAHAQYVDQRELKIARISVSELIDGNVSLLNFHYLVGEPKGVDYFTERHELGLFAHEEYVGVFEDCGLRVIHDREGLFGRGLYIGMKSDA